MEPFYKLNKLFPFHINHGILFPKALKLFKTQSGFKTQII